MRYRTIVADPPWPFKDTGRRTGESPWGVGYSVPVPYDTMALDDIRALPVGDMAGSDAHLYVWTINAHVAATYEIVAAWGFKPSALLTWCKAPKGIGLGGAYTSTTEFILFGRRGSLAPLRRWDSTWFSFKRQGAHSAKPDAFLDVVEQVSPGPYAELFARRARFGWDYPLGDESLGGVAA